MNGIMDKLQPIVDVVNAAVGVCYYSPLVEKTADGLYGARFFFKDGESPVYSMIVDYLNTLDEIIGIEFFMGDRCYADGEPGDFLVTFSETRPLANILPFVKDFLMGNVPDDGGIYLPKP